MLVGASVAAPFGPVALLCTKRGLMGKPYLGFISGLGAATAHGMFASLAISGADVVASALAEWRTLIHLTSAAILIALGIRILRKSPANQKVEPTVSHQKAYLSGMMLALTNPMTILPYLAFGSTRALAVNGSSQSGLLMVFGVMLGAAGWYTVLTSAAAAVRDGLARSLMRHLNIGAGAALMGFGVMVGLG